MGSNISKENNKENENAKPNPITEKIKKKDWKKKEKNVKNKNN